MYRRGMHTATSCSKEAIALSYLAGQLLIPRGRAHPTPLWGLR